MAAKPEGDKLKPDTTLVLRGTFEHRYFAVRDGEPPRVRLKDCELVSRDEPLPSGGDPWSPGSGPILAEDLHEAVFGWQGETVRVSGYYKGSSHSSATDETSHGIKTDARGETVVHCHEAGKTSAPDSVEQDRAGAVVEGKIAEPGWNEIKLAECRWVV